MTMDLEPACDSWLPSSIADAALRFDGEQVELRAQLRCRSLATGASGQRQTLQLLADEDLLLAELALEALQADATGLASIQTTLALNPPAGQQSRKLSLALVTHADGKVWQDRWRFALPRRFLQPSLEGAVRLRIANGMPTLEIDAISNPRAAAVSGTLALELWTLERPYRGGSFQGQPLGSVTLGSLAGQQRWSSWCRSWQLPERPAARASGPLTLMLREWTPAGYVTRDWRELDWPRDAASEIPINRCSTAALRSLPGISDRLARIIVASRPFAALDDLRRVRGMSAKAYSRLLDRVTI